MSTPHETEQLSFRAHFSDMSNWAPSQIVFVASNTLYPFIFKEIYQSLSSEQ